jgi:hypothetical protein
LWAFIKRHGSSSAHFTITHKGYELAFYGLTEEEFNTAEALHHIGGYDHVRGDNNGG